MEDISRELEKEIAQTKPKPFKQDLKTRILIIDDFGRMKSGEHLKKLLVGLSIGTIVFLLTTVLFSFLYLELSSRSSGMLERLENAEKNFEKVKQEKEVLMARLVIQGKEPSTGLDKKQPPSQTIAAAPEKKPSPRIQQPKPSPVKSEAVKKESPKKEVLPKSSTEPDKPVPGPNQATENDDAGKKVAIEKFTVVRDNGSNDLLVRFDIRNISTAPGDVSGRIFTLLKPDKEDQDEWLVVPGTPLKDGMPLKHRKGQYFSIAHFKPVKFRIKNQPEPESFKTASIYIFTTKGQLMLEKHISISDQKE